MAKHNMVKGLEVSDLNTNDNGLCEGCVLGKSSRKPFTASDSRAAEINDLVHVDLMGPMKVTSNKGKKYLLTLLDDFSRHVEAVAITNKSDAVENLKEYCKRNKVKTIRSDGGGELIND